MKRFAVLAVVLAIVGLLVGSAAGDAHEKKAKRTTLVVDVLFQASRVTLVDHNENGRPDVGDAYVGTVDVFRRGTRRRIGTAGFTNLVVSTRGDGLALFSAGLRLRRGDLFLEGVTTLEEDGAVFDAIVGGTRAFAGARGQARERILDEGDDTSRADTLIRVRLTFTTQASRRR